MMETQLSSLSKEHNNYYYIVFVDQFDKDKIKEVLNYKAPIGFCSLVYKPEYDYSFDELLAYIKEIDKAYSWKLHEITLPRYPLTESIDVVLDTNIRKNNTTHYIVYDNISDCDENYFDQLSFVFKDTKNVDAVMKKNDPYNGLVVRFSSHMILNKNNQEPLINKLIENEKHIIYL